MGVSNKISALLTPCHTWTVGPLCWLQPTDSMSGALLCLRAQVITPGIYDSGAGVWNHVRVYRKN